MYEWRALCSVTSGSIVRLTSKRRHWTRKAPKTNRGMADYRQRPLSRLYRLANLREDSVHDERQPGRIYAQQDQGRSARGRIAAAWNHLVCQMRPQNVRALQRWRSIFLQSPAVTPGAAGVPVSACIAHRCSRSPGIPDRWRRPGLTPCLALAAPSNRSTRQCEAVRPHWPMSNRSWSHARARRHPRDGQSQLAQKRCDPCRD